MSYWFGLAVDTGASEPLLLSPDDHEDPATSDPVILRALELDDHPPAGANYTSNTAPMWTRALTAVSGRDVRLRDLENALCEDVAGVLRGATAWMLDHGDELRALEPGNGWGSYGGATAFLANIARWCGEHPRARLHLSF